MEHPRMALRPLLWSGHPRLGGQDEQVEQPEALILCPVADVDVRAVHPVIVDHVLALEDHHPAGLEHSPRFRERPAIVFLQFLVSVVATEAGGHRHLAVVVAPVLHVGQEGRIEDAVSERVRFQWQHLAISLDDSIVQRRDVEAVFRTLPAFPERAIAIGHVALEAARTVELFDSSEDFRVGVIDRPHNGQQVRGGQPAFRFEFKVFQ